MGKFIVKFRKIILCVAAILLIPAIFGMVNTRINYDMLTYLPSDMETVIGQNELLSSFGKGAFSLIITENMSAAEQADFEEQVKNVAHVDSVLGFGTLENAGIPAEILPDDIYDKFNTGNESLIAVFFDTSTSADETLSAVTEIRNIAGAKAHLSGMSAFSTDLRDLSKSEEILYVVIAASLALIVMLVLLDNWLAPVLFMVSIGVMILINLGTNIIFGEISYITKALSAILQLAVTMDYSIFLWHSFREHLASDGAKTKNKDVKSRAALAMEAADNDTLSSVFGGSATTIAGFLALCFMTFTLGIDLGLVMAKGVLLGVIGAVTVLPALILTFSNIIIKLDHRSILPKFDKVSRAVVKAFPALVVLFIAIIPPFFMAYQNTNSDVYYNISKSLPQDMDFAVANKKLSEHFGLSNVHMILSSADLNEVDMHAMTSDLKNVAGIESVLNLQAVLGDEVPLDVLPESVLELARSDKWYLTLLVSEYETATDEIATQITDINTIIKKYDSSALLVSESSSTQDMINLTSVDFQVVNTISIVAIFVIIMVVTRSISLPFILIAVIESAIFINLGLCSITGEQLSFITPICISTIQLGATVDYAILMTTRYMSERQNGKDKRTAAEIALKTSIPSIIVSGAVLFAATIGVAVYSRADMISSMCMLMARGAVISIVAVPAFLPPLLIFADPLIIRTTLGMKNIKSIKERNK
ncbi:MMPL family transporter [Candidatus Saccharibacteria bacterium]|nr:MMPL family transporter [Candidatus Saccharibacteria bacterium]